MSFATLVGNEGFAHPERTIYPEWSPDSKWIAFTKRLKNEFNTIFVWSMDQKRAFQITDGMSDCKAPAWDKGGKLLYFLGSTDLALNVGWLDRDQPFEFIQTGRRKLMKQRDMRGQMVAFGRKMRGAQRIEEALVCRAHRSSQNNRRGASNPGGKGDGPDHHAREGMADAIAGGMPSSMGRPVSLAGALADSGTMRSFEPLPRTISTGWSRSTAARPTRPASHARPPPITMPSPPPIPSSCRRTSSSSARRS